MQYGAMNFPIKPIFSEIEEIASLEFDFLELSMDAPLAHYAVIKPQKDAILTALARHSLGLVCHLPCFVFTADLTESIRLASLNEMLNSLDVVSELNARKAILHPSIISGLGVYAMDISLKYAFDSLDTIAAKADELGIALCLENMFPRYQTFYETGSFSDIFNRYPNLKLTLDTGHANIGSVDGRRVLDFIEHFGHRLAHLHVSDNLGKRDDHFPIGQGNIDFTAIISALKHIGYNDTVTIEVFAEDRHEVQASREKFESMVAATD